MGEQQPPQRVVVTSPRAKVPRAARHTPVRREIDEQSGLGDVYVRSMMRTSLRLGLTVSALVGGVLAVFPPLFGLVPGLRAARVLGVELPWLVLGVLVYPFVMLAGWLYLRRIERREDEFTELVDEC
ncbi:hypothetical protein [Saccharopolyspora shandongensis]|uniref:hypothetical protein n=1 Tax=Saccharopolyspora shandongensis TaxID=418495 RepID=UPI0033C6CAA4